MPQAADSTHSLDHVLELREAITLMMEASDRTALLDEHGRISAINPAWRESARRGGGSVAASGRGVDYLARCDQAAATGQRDAAALADALRRVMGREASGAQVTLTWRDEDGEEARSTGTVRRVRGPLENWFLVSLEDAGRSAPRPLSIPEVGVVLAGSASRADVERQLADVTSHVALLDLEGRIVAVNAAWSRFSDDLGAAAEATGPGADYLAVCEDAVRAGDRRGGQFAAGLRQVLEGRRRTWWLDHRVNADGQIRLFRGRASRVETTDGPLVVVSHTDLSAAATLRAAA